MSLNFVKYSVCLPSFQRFGIRRRCRRLLPVEGGTVLGVLSFDSCLSAMMAHVCAGMSESLCVRGSVCVGGGGGDEGRGNTNVKIEG